MGNPLAKLMKTGQACYNVCSLPAKSPLARSIFGGNAIFAGRMGVHGDSGVFSTITVENVADLSRLTSYKDFFISFCDDEFA